MTNRIAVKNRASEIFYKTALALLLILPLVFSEEIREGFSEGARLSFEAVLPAVFPYMILSKMIKSERICPIIISAIRRRFLGDLEKQ